MIEVPVIMLGSGGHSKVVLESLRSRYNVTLLTTLTEKNEDEVLKKHPPGSIKLINGIGSIGSPSIRENVFLKFKQFGYEFLNVIHATAYVSPESSIGEGVQLITRSLVHPGCVVGNNVIVNTHASIDHDCHIGNHVHIAPGVICCGGVTVGNGTHIGAGAVLLQGINIGEYCIIGAGAVVTKNVPSKTLVTGIPAKAMEKL